jgi:hypothetical protein
MRQQKRITSSEDRRNREVMEVKNDFLLKLFGIFSFKLEMTVLRGALSVSE